jgi:hypothetical protein
MIQKFELECEDSLLFPPKRRRRHQLTTHGSPVGSDDADHGFSIQPPAQPAACPKCNPLCQLPLGAGVVNRCLPCELNLDRQSGKPVSHRNVTTRYQKFRGCPYSYPEEKERGRKNKSRLYRKREKPFYGMILYDIFPEGYFQLTDENYTEYRAADREEKIPKMEAHLFYGKKRKREGQTKRVAKRARLE